MNSKIKDTPPAAFTPLKLRDLSPPTSVERGHGDGANTAGGGGVYGVNHSLQENKSWENTGENAGNNTENNAAQQRTRDGIDTRAEISSKSKQLFENRIEREWLSTEEAAYFLSISSNALRIMVHRGQLQAYKIGRRLRFSVRDCRALFERKGA